MTSNFLVPCEICIAIKNCVKFFTTVNSWAGSGKHKRILVEILAMKWQDRCLEVLYR
jgi:hypothetical protein